MRRRQYLAVSVGIAASIGGSASALADDGQDGPTDPDSEYEPIQFDGTGAAVTDEFELEGGVTIAEASHDGESNFIVDLIPTDDGREELLVNVIGSFDGATGVLAESGTYLLDVDADGEWEIEILQPRVTDESEDDIDELPVELDGDEPTWTGPIRFDGLGQAHGSHEGAGNFIVEVLPENEQFSELVFNEIGEFEGETTFDVDGIGYATVEADGPWSLTME